MRIAVSGVNGFIGSELARRWVAAGHSVTGLSRRRPAGLPLEAFHAATLGAPVPDGTFSGIDLVIHAAHDRTPGAEQLNIAGTRAWAEQARREGVRHQLFLTSVSAHASAPSEYGRAKASLERYFDSIGGLMVRPGLVVGNGGTFGDMARMVTRLPIMPVLGGDRLKVVLTDLDSLFDVVRRFQELRPANAYNLFQPEWIGLLSLSRGLKQHFKRRTVFIPVPVQLAIGLLALGQKAGLPATLSPESLQNLEQCQTYGYRSHYDALGLPTRPLSALLERAFATRTP